MEGSTLFFGGNKAERIDRVGEWLLSLGFSNLSSPKILTLSANNDPVFGFNSVEFLSRKSDSKQSDKKTNKNKIGISEAKEAISFLTKLSNKKDRKALVIVDAHKLTIEAQNSLLKTLEELPENTFILLETQQKSDLATTVISRCRLINVVLDERMGEGYSGDLLDNSALAISDDSYDYFEISGLNLGEQLKVIAELSKIDKNELDETLTLWLKQIRSKIHKVANKVATSSQNEIAMLNSSAKNVLKLKNDLSKTNLSAQLGLEKIFIEQL